MGFHLPLIFAILSLAAVALANNAAQPAPQLYWNSVLPNTQMPRSISELLHPDSTNEEKSKPEIFPLQGNRVYTQSHYKKRPPPPSDEGKPETFPLGNSHYTQTRYKKRPPPPSDEGKPENFPLGNSHYTQTRYKKRPPPPSDEGKPENFPLANSFYTQTRYKKRPPPPSDEGKPENFPLANSFYTQSHYKKRPPPPSDEGKPENFPLARSPPSDSQLKHYKDLAIFFFEKDMRPGTTMKFQFPRNSNTATFLPRESAQSIPFSSKKLPEIFNHFSVKPTSEEAKTIKQTIEECEAPGLKGEEKYCATSLESMVDFSTSKLGTRNVEAISTEVLEEGATKYMHNYTTMPGLKKLEGDKVVVCHKENYPYAVFLCHAIKQTEAYVLSLKADDGMKVKAVTICHLDTSEWDPEHLSFQILNVKPGTTPICHFLTTDAIAWVPKHKSA
ncbi:hypothetical protein PRUPE_1G476200 [Prunus persica]|uniref:Uncharacterized protein n=1 Tax=Prunus persica TaxID=3760 RepID=M5XD28_PRUPE|nr:BURP domain protein RD22 [Prunus persica]ONI34341.1 hypothetical protein PRUPE_1G476200 [Prunus persica]